MLWFVMAMVLFPHTMRRAQAEIDSVVGEDGGLMPGFANIDQLPYCVALTKELFRCVALCPRCRAFRDLHPCLSTVDASGGLPLLQEASRTTQTTTMSTKGTRLAVQLTWVSMICNTCH